MKILVPTFGGDAGRSGIGRYIIQLLRQFDALAGERPDLDFEVLVFEDEEEIFLGGISKLAVRRLPGRYAPPVRNILWHQTRLPSVLRESSADVLFLPAGNRRLVWSSPVPAVGTVHDFSALHMTGKYDPARTLYIKKVLPAFVRRLDRVLTVSESSARDIVEYAGVPAERVDVVPCGVDLELYRPGDPEAGRALARERFGVRGPYLLYVSRLEHPGKNHVGLIRAWNLLRERGFDVELLLAGGDWNGAEAVRAEAAASPWKEDIHLPGFVSDADLPALYAGAEALSFPSLYEGFGLPVLEAMAAGCPVACADRSSLPEVAGDAALLYDPEDPGSQARALERLLREPALREELRRRGRERARAYTWRRAAEGVIQSLERALCGRRGGRRAA